MSENHPNGFLKHAHHPIGYRDPRKRIGDYKEIYNPTWDENQLKEQGERCMDCGVPTCMAGCPIGNIIPEWNDLVYRDNWKADRSIQQGEDVRHSPPPKPQGSEAA